MSSYALMVSKAAMLTPVWSKWNPYPKVGCCKSGWSSDVCGGGGVGVEGIDVGQQSAHHCWHPWQHVLRGQAGEMAEEERKGRGLLKIWGGKIETSEQKKMGNKKKIDIKLCIYVCVCVWISAPVWQAVRVGRCLHHKCDPYASVMATEPRVGKKRQSNIFCEMLF